MHMRVASAYKFPPRQKLDGNLLAVGFRPSVHCAENYAEASATKLASLHAVEGPFWVRGQFHPIPRLDNDELSTTCDSIHTGT